MARKPNTTLSYSRVPPFLRDLRMQAGLTQRELASKLKRPQWWVARIETGSRRVDVIEFAEFVVGCGSAADTSIRRLVGR